MELSSNVIKSLKAINGSGGSSGDLSNESFQVLVKSVFDSFIIDSKSGDFNLNLDTATIEKLGKTPGELKDITASLYTLISEFAKNDIDVNSISTHLEDLGFSNERIKAFLESYESKSAVIRLFLSSSSSSFPHIVDVNWRLDYRIKENNMERINKPVYLIELKVEKPNQSALSTIEFNCTIEQLQDFVYKLREATKSLEKLAQIQ